MTQNVLIENLLISYVIPVYNEQLGISDFLNAFTIFIKTITPNYEIIIIDDGSNDNTYNIVSAFTQNPKIKLLQFSRNFGKEIAISAGLEYCKGDAAIIIDSDFQHPFDLIPIFLKHWQSGYDMVFGIQNIRNNETKIKRYLTKIFYKILQFCTKEKIPANAGDFRLLDRKIIDVINTCTERGCFMKGIYAWVGFSSIGIKFNALPRNAGKSSLQLNKLTELALTGITSFSNVPLRIWSLIGLITSMITFITAIYIIIKTLVYGIEIPGYASLMVTVIFFGGIQLLSIGILGEYIARIFNEVKQRPRYIINRMIGFKK